MRGWFWLRWAGRDLRRRPVQVVAIATIVALGSGVYAGLGSTSVWRRVSLDASYTRLGAHDVRVRGISQLATTPDRLTAAIRAIAGDRVTRIDTRLVVDLPVRAGNSLRIPAAGEILGVEVGAPNRVDRWRVVTGRDLRAGDQVVLLDDHFATAHGLAPSGTLRIGATTVRYVGTALQPEYLNTNVAFGATIQGAGTRAVVYAPLEVAQRLAGLPGQVNDAALRLRRGVDPSALARQLDERLTAELPEFPARSVARRDDPDVRALYDEITSEQRIFDVFALLILAGAGFATFNLTRRVVESQRHDIGVAMALGVPPREIAIRPLVMGLQIAVIGLAVGLVAGWGLGVWVLSIIRTQLPLPVWRTPWQGGLFTLSAVLGLTIPLVGTSYPVWRAVRVAPTDALLPPHLRHRRRGGRPGRQRVRLPGGTLVAAPFRRLAIAPARTVLTTLGVGVILAPLFAALATTASATHTIEVAGAPAGGSTDRLLVNLTGYQPADSPQLAALTASPLVADHAVSLNTGGYLERHGRRTIGVSISMVDLDDSLAVPAEVAERHLAPGGIVISSKAASDLGLGEGDRVTLRHPVREGTGYRFTTTSLPVRAVAEIPYRFVAYMDIADEPIMGLDGIVNALTLTPRNGVAMDRLQRAVADAPGVAWALSARSVSDTIRDVLALVDRLFVVLQIVIGLLAFLVAYNSVKVGTDERVRENATMMAFGVTVPRIVGVGVAESLVLGMAAVAVGIGVGQLLFGWILDSVLPAAVPDLAVLPMVSTASYVVTTIVGLAATTVAPLFVARALKRLSLPSSLRFVE